MVLNEVSRFVLNTKSVENKFITLSFNMFEKRLLLSPIQLASGSSSAYSITDKPSLVSIIESVFLTSPVVEIA